MSAVSGKDALVLADFRRRVAELHLSIDGAGEAAVAEFRRGRDELFRTHPASPLTATQLGGLDGLPHFEFDPAARVECELLPPTDDSGLEIDSGGEDGVIAYSRVGALETPWGRLTLFWTEGYGGGLFLPFRDATPPMRPTAPAAISPTRSRGPSAAGSRTGSRPTARRP